MSLIVALAGYTVLHEAPDAVRTYRELTPAGAPIDALPASLQFSAGNFLDGLADEPENALKLKIEFVSSWPEIAIHSDGTVRRFVLPGFDPNHWQHSGHRRSTTINVAAFADVITELFGEQS
ncbi:hypothetical protein LB557_02045 [Mesorhizobium sp. BR115XR7A]|uniref:hypothetical protein n=1 Tax=Mesorhizobium sp. BR115XR7A TaxID=2876645 RepID=UPI001CD17E7C|nr:hypothetical protein [Mesorhizobium sp. BR115XR7A]MBZ9904789.1 hypothetical protein [Mesorhizobium sp. BR115XR7A]